MTHRDYLFGLLQFGIKLGLENISFMLDAAGSPQNRYPTVHVAGTNGKGSVAAILDAIARAAGIHTGRFTSPHLIDVNERFLLDDVPIDDAALDRHIEFFRAIAERMPRQPTFFEMTTAVAFRHFQETGTELGIIEVGLGGRFDSTNIIVPLAGAITNIDFDHTRQLGHTLGEIAREKAGIIKPGVPVVVGETRDEPLRVILGRAAQLESPVRLRGRDFSYRLDGGPFAQQFSYESPDLRVGPVPLRLHGTYQGENAAVAVAVAESLREHLPQITLDAIASGLREARWPCRLDRVLDSPPVLIDVAHNLAGARCLARQLPKCVAIMGISSDKPAREMMQALSGVVTRLILTRFDGKRALPVDDLCAAAEGLDYVRAENLAEAIRIGMELASDGLPLLITGSVFTAGEARRILIESYGAPELRF